MKYSCLHTHTTFCDGNSDVESFCQRAWEKGLHSLGFSSHAPIVKKTGFPQNSWNMREDLLEEYINTVKAAKSRWEGRLAIFLGLEIDFISGLMGPSDKDYREMGLDYIIGAVHFLIPEKGGPFTVDDVPEIVDRGIREGFGGDVTAMLEAYFDSMTAMIHAGGFDLLAHPDVVKKNNSGSRMFSEDDSYYRGKAAALAALTADAGIPAEVNSGGINRGKIKDCYPSLWLLKLFREHDVPMVINADAHSADDLDGHYKEAQEALLAAGYTETALFDGRKNGRAVWKTIRI